MKCCGSPTTSIARNVVAPRVASGDASAFSAAVRDRAQVVAGVEAIVMRAAFAPLAKAMGFYGDLVVAAALDGLTRTSARGTS